MADKKYTQTGNNSRFYIDKTKRLDALMHTIETARSTAYTAESVVYMRVKQPIFSSIALVIGADVHSGAVGSNAIREERAIEFVRRTCNCIYVPAGDVFNSITKEGEDKHEDLFGNQRAIEREISLLTPIKHKIPIILDGNHDGQNGKRWVGTNMSPTKHLADALGVEHGEFGVLLSVEMHTSDYRRKSEVMTIFVSHCAGKTSGAAKSVDITYEKAMQELRSKGVMPDIIFGGHFHANADATIPMEYLVYDDQGKCVGTRRKDVIVVSESTLQETSRYALAGGYPPTDSNVYINNLSLIKNPYFNSATRDTQSEYLVQMVRFPMFKTGTNEYTDMALEYMQNYREPTELRDEVAREYSGKPYNSQIKGLTREFRDFKSARFLLDEPPSTTHTTGATLDDGSGNDGM